MFFGRDDFPYQSTEVVMAKEENGGFLIAKN